MKWQYIYLYEAYSEKNEYCLGKLVANSKRDAFLFLTQQQKIPIKIRLYRIILFQEKDKQYRIQLLEQLGLLLRSGLPLLSALTLLKDECRYTHWQCILEDIIYHLMMGHSLSTQLKRYPLYFPLSLTHFIYVGEESGKLDEVIHLQTEQLKKQREIIKKIKKAFKYPLFLLIALFLITIAMLLYVLPEYQSLYNSFNANLPSLTLILISCSQWLIHYGLFVINGTIALILFYLLARYHSSRFKIIEQCLLLKLPYLGLLLRYHQLQLIFQIISITQQAGLPLLQGLTIITQQLTHPLYRQAVSQITEQITQGKSLSSCIKNKPLFPAICYQFIISAENSGQLLHFCHQLSDWFYHQLNTSLNNVTTWLEPMLMTIIALIIGTLIIAMYLPILHLGDTIQ